MCSWEWGGGIILSGCTQVTCSITSAKSHKNVGKGPVWWHSRLGCGLECQPPLWQCLGLSPRYSMLSIPLPATAPGKAAAEGPSTEGPATPLEAQGAASSGFMALPWPGSVLALVGIWGINQQTGGFVLPLLLPPSPALCSLSNT